MDVFSSYRKKSLTRAAQINGPEDVGKLPGWLHEHVIPGTHGFDVYSREGNALSTAYGSWLALDNNNNPYPIAADVFETTYEPAGPTDSSHCPDCRTDGSESAHFESLLACENEDCRVAYFDPEALE